jgi:uncharacterized membrane protein
MTKDEILARRKEMLTYFYIGALALLATFFTGMVIGDQQQGVKLTVDGLLLLVVGVCFLTAGAKARKLKRNIAENKAQ